ncbi:hypothetical protein PQU92_08110 [Asticcacaulis sp. BYS171W]|uniref:Uncharacterized protein n=1 Tax=Asticcacaulis aquaticus TaxID=2984212 RepID=A0ABT5HT32_9CAUL|nr:hypothetical protein [Asticcacaulis aquaticus]MDC7683238.1 hypothetical protein [Asticcacaulis aquaticus]
MLEITIRGPVASGKTTIQEEAISRLRKIGVSAFNGDILRTPKAAQTLNADILIKTEMTGVDLHWAFTQSKPSDNAVLRVAARTIMAESIDDVLKKFADAKPKPTPAPEAVCPGYLVWNPAHGGPRVNHPDMTSAVTEAMRLADQYPDNHFYVMAPVQEFIVHEIRTKAPIQITAVGQTFEPEKLEWSEAQKIRMRIPLEMRDAADSILNHILDCERRGVFAFVQSSPVLTMLESEKLIFIDPAHGGHLKATFTCAGELLAKDDEIPF